MLACDKAKDHGDRHELWAAPVLRHIRVASKHELKERIMAGIDGVNRDPVIHTLSYKPADVA